MKNKNLIYLIIFSVIIILVSEIIGFRILNLGKFKIGLLPLIFALILTMIFATKIFRKGIFSKIYTEENVNFAGKYLIIIMLPLMAKYGADVAPRLKELDIFITRAWKPRNYYFWTSCCNFNRT